MNFWWSQIFICFFLDFLMIFQRSDQFDRPLRFDRPNLSGSAPRQVCQPHFKWGFQPHFTPFSLYFFVYHPSHILWPPLLLPSPSHLNRILKSFLFPYSFPHSRIPISPNPNPFFLTHSSNPVDHSPLWLPKLAPSAKGRNQSMRTPHLGMIIPHIPPTRRFKGTYLELSIWQDI